MAEWVGHEGVRWQSGLDIRGAVAEKVRHDGRHSGRVGWT